MIVSENYPGPLEVGFFLIRNPSMSGLYILFISPLLSTQFPIPLFSKSFFTKII